MRVIEISQFGPPEVLKLAERPDPVPAAGEVLIDVAAAGVNRPDVIQRLGKYPPPPGASDIPGLEVAGIVAALGEGVRGWSVGDRGVRAGGRRRLCRAAPPCRRSSACRFPKGLTAIEAAAIPETFFTVWTNVFERGRLQAGEIDPDPRRHERHRHHRDPAGAGLWRAGARPPPAATRSATRAAQLGADACVQLPDADWVAEAQARHRRPRRRRDPRHRRRRLHRAQPRSAGDRRTAGADRVPEDAEGGARLLGDDAQARAGSPARRCGRGRRRRRARSRASCSSTSGRCSSRAWSRR